LRIGKSAIGPGQKVLTKQILSKNLNFILSDFQIFLLDFAQWHFVDGVGHVRVGHFQHLLVHVQVAVHENRAPTSGRRVGAEIVAAASASRAPHLTPRVRQPRHQKAPRLYEIHHLLFCIDQKSKDNNCV